jgi:hypothetical protein
MTVVPSRADDRASAHDPYVSFDEEHLEARPRELPTLGRSHQQLRELERDGLLVRQISHPRTVQYMLTPLGASLVPHLTALAAWSEQHEIAARLLANGNLRTG